MVFYICLKQICLYYISNIVVYDNIIVYDNILQPRLGQFRWEKDWNIGL